MRWESKHKIKKRREKKAETSGLCLSYSYIFPPPFRWIDKHGTYIHADAETGVYIMCARGSALLTRKEENKKEGVCKAVRSRDPNNTSPHVPATGQDRYCTHTYTHIYTHVFCLQVAVINCVSCRTIPATQHRSIASLISPMDKMVKVWSRQSFTD